jgi:hypothetical protein
MQMFDLQHSVLVFAFVEIRLYGDIYKIILGKFFILLLEKLRSLFFTNTGI